jgi:hypothetical protein
MRVPKPAHRAAGHAPTAFVVVQSAHVPSAPLVEKGVPLRPLACASRRVVLGAALTLISRVAWAIDPFEIQVYDATANAAGEAGLELHLNRVVSGSLGAPAPELPPNHQSHATLEPSFGVLPWWELGAYFQTTLRADGVFDYSGVKLRSKFVTPEGSYPHLRYGVNVELSFLPQHYDAGQWGAELRPIIAWENSTWLFAANPILSFGLKNLGEGPEFEPAAEAKLKLLGVLGVGFEYYAAFGRLAAPLPREAQGQYLYECIDWLSIPAVEINFGVGEGLTRSSNDLTVKLILGYSWET